jgi:hypothetical protein
LIRAFKIEVEGLHLASERIFSLYECPLTVIDAILLTGGDPLKEPISATGVRSMVRTTWLGGISSARRT